MCGILGWLSVSADPERFKEMLSLLSHRGPDTYGIQQPRPHVLIGHTRLSIIDLSDKGNQPLFNESKSICAVVNGEIYNYRLLRSELEKAGHHFYSQSDSEVVVHAYAEWGDKFLSQLRGIFALAVYEIDTDRLLLAIDQSGVKPLYYYHAHQSFLFSSEIKSIKMGVDLEYNSEAMWSYLSYRYMPGSLTPYKSLEKLLPGHFLVYERNKYTVSRYWTPEYSGQVAGGDVNPQDLLSCLEDSVDSQLVSDVPVGLLLSGGIDSSAVGALASKKIPDLQAFCCGFSHSVDERGFAQSSAEHCGIDLIDTVMGWSDFIDELPYYLDWYDEPFYDASGMAYNRLCKLAKKHEIKVLLSGDGADEIFAGYNWYDTINALSQQKNFDFRAEYFNLLGYFTTTDLEELSGKKLDYDHLWFFDSIDRNDLPVVSRAQWLDFHSFLPWDVLTKVDRASMATSVEVRVPFLDQNILENYFLLPQDSLYKNGERKHLLKKSLNRTLPENILTSRKKGFGFPLLPWADKIIELARKYMINGCLVDFGHATPAGVKKVISEKHVNFIWLLLSAELWLRRFQNGEEITDLLS